MGATLIVLGAGSILPRAGHGPAGYALAADADGPVTLLDCGPGTVRALGDAGIELARVRRVVFSHFHLDHCLDLYALAFARRNPAFGAPPRLELHGPAGLRALFDEAPATFGEWGRDPNATLHEVALDADGCGGFDATDDGTRGAPLRFRCVRNGHSTARVTLSWRVEFAGGAALLYTGDTNADARVAVLGRGADLFLAECSHPDEAAPPKHLTPSSAARLARDAGARRLVLTHFYPDIEPGAARERASDVFDGVIEVARDGRVFEIESGTDRASRRG